MAASSALRLLVGAGRQLQSSSQALPAALRSFASASGEFTRKDVVYFMDNRDDPEVDSAISAHLRDAYAKAEKGQLTTAPPAADGLELTAQVERKYIAAQIVESSIQNIAVPFAAETDAPIKRYISELLDAGSKAGLEAPEAELSKKLADGARGVGSVKEFLGRVQPLVPAAFHAALLEAVQEVEDAAGGTVAFDGASEGYKQFAAKLKVLAAKHGVPVDLLGASTDDAAKKYQAWQQGARVADVRGDLAGLESEVVKALDNHLAKDSAEIRKSQQANLAAFVRRLEANKGQPWATAFLQDLKAVEAFDAAVAANPQKGPVA